MRLTNLHLMEAGDFGQRIHAVLFPSSPIQSHEFLFGRDGQLDRIRKALMAPGRQVFIYGERGVGKSSLAGAAAAEVQSSDATPLHASCGSSSTFTGVIWSLIRATDTEPSQAATVHNTRGLEGKGLTLSRSTETNTQPTTAPLDKEDAAADWMPLSPPIPSGQSPSSTNST